MIFLIFFIFTIFSKHISVYAAQQIELYDFPNDRKKHKKVALLFGGIFIFLNIFFFSLICHLYKDFAIFIHKSYLSLLVLNILIFFIIGILDDLKNLRPNTKIIFIIPVLILNVIFFNNLFIYEINFFLIDFKLNYILSLTFTVTCIFIFLNAFNMFDGINGQCGIYSIYFFLYLIFKGINIELNIYIIFIIIIFLFYNLRNITFLGNSGNLVLGFILSTQSIYGYNFGHISQEEILLLMILPGLDLIRLFFTRIVNGKHPMDGDLNHIQHLLISKYSILKSNLLLIMLLIFPTLIFIFFNSKFYGIIFSILSYVLYIYLLKRS